MTSMIDRFSATNEAGIFPSEAEDPGFKINLVINNDARVAIMHNRHFRKKLSWLEFNVNQNRVDFVMNDGDIRNFGIPVPPDMAPYLQNTHMILMILVDDENNELAGGQYLPLLIHRT